MKQFATITVIGRDKSGVVARVTNFLFEQKANIEALEEQVTRGQFSMNILASWESTLWDPKKVQSGLQILSDELGMEIRIQISHPRKHKRVALMVTREPHCLEKLLSEAKTGKLKMDPVVVIGNRNELKDLALGFGLPYVRIPWDDRAKAEERAFKVVENYQADFVVLARFMKILSPNFVWRLKNKIINIHPSLLPSFPGPQAYRQAYEHGVKMAGVTAHFVSMHLDEGPIIAQDCFPIKPGMTLQQIVEKGQSLEATVLAKAVKLYLANQLDVHWGVVKQV